MLIGKKIIPEEKILELIADVKKKKELREVSNGFVRDHLFAYLKENPKRAAFLLTDYSKKSASYKKTIKEIRARLRKVYGLFRREEEAKKRRELVEELLSTPKTKRKKIIAEILATHSSTKERLPFYEKLYQKIFKITGKPQTIIDLGCGINPFSVPYLKLKKLNYHAFDISEEEIYLLNEFFALLHRENKSFRGKAAILDVLQWNKLAKIKDAEVCFLFKMTDVLDRGKGHKTTEEVIKLIPAKFVVVSFATRTMSGKRMTAPRRKWMEWMCKRLGYKYQILEFKNEIFYVVEK